MRCTAAGSGLWEEEIRHLGRHLLALCLLLVMPKPQNKFVSLRVDTDRDSGPFKLGQLHVLRNRVLDVSHFCTWGV